jgi:hypothetical protein
LTLAGAIAVPVRVTVRETEPLCCATEYSSAENAIAPGCVVVAVDAGVAAGVVISLLVVLGAAAVARAADNPGLPDDVSDIPPHAARASVRAKVAATRSTVAVRVIRIIT